MLFIIFIIIHILTSVCFPLSESLSDLSVVILLKAILTDMKWYFMALMMSDGEHFSYTCWSLLCLLL